MKSRGRNQRFPNIGGHKRTRSLDDSRTVQVGWTVKGEPIFSEVGDILLNGDEQRQLAEKLERKPKLEVVRQMADAVTRKAAMEFIRIFAEIAPQNVIDDSPHEGPLFRHWMCNSGFSMTQDGLHTVIKLKDKILAEFDAKIDPRFARDVEVEIRLRQIKEETQLPSSSITGGG